MSVTDCGASITFRRSRDADNTIGNSERNSRSESSCACKTPQHDARQSSAQTIEALRDCGMPLPRTDRGVLIVVKMVSCEPILKSFQSN
jgi:hypothetical protein